MDGVGPVPAGGDGPGDVVALESPARFSFLEVLQGLHLKALEVPTHPRHGVSLDALQLALETQPVKALLVVPTLSSPLGACMPQGERRPAWRSWPLQRGTGGDRGRRLQRPA